VARAAFDSMLPHCEDGLAAGSTDSPLSFVVDGTLTLHDLSILSDPFFAF
jgi:hypothetical protein